MRSSPRVIVERVRTYVRTADGALPGRGPVPPTVYMPHDAMTWPYDPAPLNDLLLGYAQPLLALVVDVDAIVCMPDAPPDVAEARQRLADERLLDKAAARAWTEYVTMRMSLIDCGGAHRRLGPDQRMALLSVWLAGLRLRVHARALDKEPGDARTSRDYAYVVRSSELTRQAMHVGDGARLMCHWTLGNWAGAMRHLVEVIEAIGAAVPGLQDYWYSLWRRLSELLEQTEQLAAVPNVRFGPDLDGDGDVGAAAATGGGADNDDEEDEDEDDEQALEATIKAMRDMGILDVESPALHDDAIRAARIVRKQNRAAAAAAGAAAQPSLLDADDVMGACEAEDAHSDAHSETLREPLPYVHRGRRLCVAFLERMEIIYAAYEQRMLALPTFLRAAARGHSVAFAAAVVPRGPESARVLVDAWVAFVQSVQDTVDPKRADEIRSQAVGRLANAHLYAGERERFIFDLLAAQRCQRNEGTDVPDDVSAAEALQRRADVYRFTSTYADRQRVKYLERIDVYLRLEEAAIATGQPTPCAHETERYAMVLLMLLANAPVNGQLRKAAWLDDLRHAETAAAIDRARGPLFRTPAQALDILGEDVILVRLLRRTFVVFIDGDGDDDDDRRAASVLYVVEVPSILVGIVMWFAVSGVALAHVPPAFLGLVRTMRTQAAAAIIAERQRHHPRGGGGGGNARA